MEAKYRKTIRQRLVIIAGAIGLFVAANYGHGITSQRAYLRDHGNVTKAEITRITSRKSLRTYFVTIDRKVYDAGSVVPGVEDPQVGEIISVKFAEGIEYVVPVGVTRYWPTFAIQYISFVGAALLLLFGLFYPTRLMLKDNAEQQKRGM